MKDSEYRELPLESYSSLKYLLESVESFKHHKEKPFTGSIYTLLGTAVHHYLQGNRHLVTVCPIDGRRKKELEKFIEDWESLKVDEEAIMVPVGCGPKLEAIMANAQSNQYVAGILGEESEYEVPVTMTINGVEVKGKCDILQRQYNRIIEIKTSSKATNLESFREEAYDRHYDLQAALYLKLYEVEEHYFIVANTMDPYSVNLYKTSKEMIDSGNKKLATVLSKYVRHVIEGKEEITGIPEV